MQTVTHHEFIKGYTCHHWFNSWVFLPFKINIEDNTFQFNPLKILDHKLPTMHAYDPVFLKG